MSWFSTNSSLVTPVPQRHTDKNCPRNTAPRTYLEGGWEGGRGEGGGSGCGRVGEGMIHVLNMCKNTKRRVDPKKLQKMVIEDLNDYCTHTVYHTEQELPTLPLHSLITYIHVPLFPRALLQPLKKLSQVARGKQRRARHFDLLLPCTGPP